jgi:hypothetical protein
MKEKGDAFFILFLILIYELKSVVSLKDANLDILGTSTAFDTAVCGIYKKDLC